jgi:hypothetical protein
MTIHDPTAADIYERAVACLGSDRRLAFLAELIYEPSLAARGLYPPDGSEERRAVAGFIAHNEMIQVLAAPLRVDLGGGEGGYPDRALVEALVSKARIWGRESTLQAALGYALEETAADVAVVGVEHRR